MIAVGYRSLPPSLVNAMKKAPIFLGHCRRRGSHEEQDKDKYKLCKVQEVLIADDMESRRKFGHRIFVAPPDEVLASKLFSSSGCYQVMCQQTFTPKWASNH